MINVNAMAIDPTVLYKLPSQSWRMDVEATVISPPVAVI